MQRLGAVCTISGLMAMALFAPEVSPDQPHLRAEAGQPNIVIVLADGVGYSELSCHGGEIEPPEIDRLATDESR